MQPPRRSKCAMSYSSLRSAGPAAAHRGAVLRCHVEAGLVCVFDLAEHRSLAGSARRTGTVARQSTREAYPSSVSVADNSHGPSHLTVATPKEALQRARLLPGDDDMAIEGLTDDE